MLPTHGDEFSEDDMLQPLYTVLDSKRAKPAYRGLTMDLVLVVHYDMALLHNTPVFTPWFSFEDAARHAREHLAGNAGPFAQIFLLKALHPGASVQRLHP
jgi:hypothetical protein